MLIDPESPSPFRLCSLPLVTVAFSFALALCHTHTHIKSLHLPTYPSFLPIAMADQELKEFGHNLLGWFKAFPSNFPRYVQERLPIIKW